MNSTYVKESENIHTCTCAPHGSDWEKLLGTHQSVESKVYKEYKLVSEKETPERKLGKQEE